MYEWKCPSVCLSVPLVAPLVAFSRSPINAKSLWLMHIVASNIQAYVSRLNDFPFFHCGPKTCNFKQFFHVFANSSYFFDRRVLILHRNIYWNPLNKV